MFLYIIYSYALTQFSTLKSRKALPMTAKRKLVNSKYILGQIEYHLVLTLQMYHESKILKITVLAGGGERMNHDS